MEYACKVAGSKLVVVLGHSKCGAVTSACQHAEMGNITGLLRKIQPAVQQVEAEVGIIDTEEKGTACCRHQCRYRVSRNSRKK